VRLALHNQIQRRLLACFRWKKWGKRDFAIAMMAARLEFRAGSTAVMTFESVKDKSKKIMFRRQKKGNPIDMALSQI
jgi:hypothetical protein